MSRKLAPTELFIELARSRNTAERQCTLDLALDSPRFDQDQKTELFRIRSDSKLGTLRPVTIASSTCKILDPLKPGPDPILPPDITAQLHQWVQGWKYAQELRLAGFHPPGPLLLFGPTGTGKTMITRAIARVMEDQRAASLLDAHRTVDSLMGHTSDNINKAFKACSASGNLLAIEELDAFAGVRADNSQSSATQENTRITVAFMRLMDEADFPIIGTTNRPDILDPAHRRRFEVQIEIPAPDAQRHRQILREALTFEPPAALLEMPLTEALATVRQIQRDHFFKTFTPPIAA